MFAGLSGLIGGFAKDWFDVRIWDHNGLALSEVYGERARHSLRHDPRLWAAAKS
ncbi:hypothetical protein [Pseudophaeobacter sp.]|uniref:hypothetical protein n=1 Tax=Pseudophaeobacter sp. TaxID=1971739 RepID=UPI00405820AB